ncbi:efflux RND transporter periplasmic adaptor subunit [Parapedobacter pyrenivorans]|uniref:efflux RND transporter periplasmic adaptor subunit n=1 Tax=Parapedobacter pyrenivorans TaxID=1305674 RepID=UPI0033420A56
MKINNYIWIGILLCFSCSRHSDPAHEGMVNTFCLNEALRDGLVIDTLQKHEVLQHLRLTGQVTYNPNKVVQFASLVEGVMVETRFSLGDYVKKGQVIASLKSPELNIMVADIHGLQANVRLAQREYNAIKSMYADHVASERDLIEAKSGLEKLAAELEGLQGTLSLFHPNPEEGTFQIRSPASGYIVEKQVSTGMPIPQGANLFTVSDLDEIWVMINVYATDIPFIQQGMPVAVRTLAYPDEEFTGQISALPQVFDSEERVLKARIVLPNADMKLKPGMAVDVSVERQDGIEAVAIPADATIFDDNQHFAIVYHDDCSVELRRLIPAIRDNNWYFVDEGFEAGELIVRQNHLLIYEKIKSL